MPSRADDARPVDLSIIIPVFNESRKIEGDIRAAVSFCSSRDLRSEILVADDGSTDATTAIAGQCALPDGIDLRVLRLGFHRGKGAAVRAGMVASRGRIVLFVDSGGCISWDDIQQGLALVAAGTCQIAHASRRLPASRILHPQPLSRRLSAFLFRHLFSRLLGLPRWLTDTQTGLKIYEGETGRSLYTACGTEGFLFDAEIILRALNSGNTICEFPVQWSADPDSRLRLRGLPFALLREGLALKRRLRREGFLTD
jgi:dolichyl-phosphate beta-glucosyltransferase